MGSTFSVAGLDGGYATLVWQKRMSLTLPKKLRSRNEKVTSCFNDVAKSCTG